MPNPRHPKKRNRATDPGASLRSSERGSPKVSITIEPDLLGRIDDARGDESRSAWLAHAAEAKLATEERTER